MERKSDGDSVLPFVLNRRGLTRDGCPAFDYYPLLNIVLSKITLLTSPEGKKDRLCLMVAGASFSPLPPWIPKNHPPIPLQSWQKSSARRQSFGKMHKSPHSLRSSRETCLESMIQLQMFWPFLLCPIKITSSCPKSPRPPQKQRNPTQNDGRITKTHSLLWLNIVSHQRLNQRWSKNTMLSPHE